MISACPGPRPAETSGIAGDRGWWAVYTKHQHEKTAAEILTAKGAEVFLPLYQAVRRWKDRRVKLAVPLFPCYLFVRERHDLRLSVLSTPGIHMIVSHGGSLALVPPAEITNLQRALQTPHCVQPHPYLRTGERVRILAGPLEGVEGMLLRQKNLCRVVISVDMLARSAAVEVDAWNVTPASPVHFSTRPASSAGLASRSVRPALST